MFELTGGKGATCALGSKEGAETRIAEAVEDSTPSEWLSSVSDSKPLAFEVLLLLL